MAVYFKFKSAKDFDSVSFEGHFISVGNLKDKIVEQKKLGRGSDFNLVISNAQTDEEYTDEGYLVPKNTSVIVRRVPGRPSMPIIADVKDERKSAAEVQAVTKSLEKLGSTEKTTTFTSPVPDGLDDFGLDLYAVPEVVHVRNTSLTEEEDNKIRAFVDQSATDWQRQTQDSFSGGKGYGNKGQGRGLPLRGAYGRTFEKKTPPHGYVCHRCGISGHYIQHCPTNGDPQYDQKKVKPPTGIPKTMLVANPDGSYALPTGEVAVLRPNEAVFEREIDGLPSSSRPALDVPLEFTCSLCKRVLKDAVLTSKCCFKSYCDECIRREILTKGQCVCGAKNILADDLLPNRTLRDAIDKIMEAQPSGATSSGQVGSRAQLPDMESARFAQPKVPSPGASVSLKEATAVESDGSDTTKPFALNKTEPITESVPKTESAGETTRVQKEAGVKNGTEADGSPESQLTKESVQEAVNSERLRKSEAEVKDEAPALLEPSKGKKRPKGKRTRQGADMPHPDGMWNQGRNFNNYGDPHQMQAENGCMHCGAFDHPSGNCPMVNGPGPSHPSMPMQGPMFGPGFNPHMRGMMPPPMGDGYMMPYHPGPYPGYGFPAYDMPFNRPMMPPQEAFIPPPVMPYGPPPPMQREYLDGPPMSRDEFEARKAEFKRRREREQRFGREQVKYPGGDFDMEPPARPHAKAGPRNPVPPSERRRDASPDIPLDDGEQIRSHRNGERRYVTGSKPKPPRVKESRIEHEEVQPDLDADGYERDYRTGDDAHDRWGSHRAVDEASSGEGDREVRYSSRDDAYFSGQYERGSKATGDLKPRRRRSASGYGSMDEADESRRRQSGSSQHVGPSSSPPIRSVRRRMASSDDRRLVTRDDEEDVIPKDGGGGGKAPSRRGLAGEKSGTGKIINLKDRPRASVFERTNLPLKPRRAAAAAVPDEEYDVIDEREFSRLKRAKGAGNRASGK